MGGGGGVPLPAGAVPIEYLETGGSGYRGFIDTGIIPDDNTKVQVKLMSSVVTGNVIVGYKGNSDQTDWRLFNSNQRIYYDAFDKRLNGGNGTLSINTIYEFELGNYYVKDIPTDTILLQGSPYTGTGVGHIYLWGETAFLSAYARVYYFKAFSSNSIIMDLVPIRIEQVGYMFDYVSGQLFGSGHPTESFILGPDK